MNPVITYHAINAGPSTVIAFENILKAHGGIVSTALLLFTLAWAVCIFLSDQK